ncbi:hypothetical protein K1T71_007445 [Dendrolimus kikuchii]|uniref:Uncharacterized protein n=2 Tax=Dendrolimus kikuchii TaxID=765133 RepID=A0ACC1D0G6_9NEOP|nr:hypothetical protein K1T71_007021 [Dendrolimus kikuchii]KAJ0177436.1 hypothetical protein K1T71_007445 [Dendrolimus kikuchii]
MEVDTECRNMLQPLKARYQDMNKEFSSISHLIDNRIKRSAWIGGIGTILKQVFGTLDENDALKYDEAITALQNNEKQLISLMKENILVTTSVIERYNETLQKIKDNEIYLSNAINNLSVSVKNITELTNGLQILVKVNEILTTLEASILTLSFQLEDITNAILFSSQNILHPAIITPNQLYRELANNHRHLPGDLELPVVLDLSNMHLILSISKLVCYYLNNKIMFVVQVPLVSTKEYMLFHNIALPTPHNPEQPNSFSLILPTNKYIAMTKDKAQYCIFNDLGNCKNVSPGNFICNVETVYSTDAKQCCESELLAKVISEKPPQCETKTVFGKIDIWKSISNNKWIYIQSESTKLSIDCSNSKLYETVIIGTGIINIPENCVGYCKSTTLIPNSNILNITSPVNSFPEFNLIDDTCCDHVKLNEIDNVSPVKLHDVDLDDFNKKSKMLLENMLSDLNSIKENPHIVRYGTHYSILTILLFICMLCYFSYVLYYKICKPRGNRPQPSRFKLKLLSPQNSDSKDSSDKDSDIEIVTPKAPTRVKV